MQKIPLLITGSSGLIASHLRHFFSHKYSFETLDVSDPVNPVDITNLKQLQTVVKRSSAKYLVHFAAFTDVTRAWTETGQKEGLTYRVNVLGTANVAQVCADQGIHLIHISTAYVFDGQNNSPYTESNRPNPIEWYGQTKLLAEQQLQDKQFSWTILRIDQPFGTLNHPKKDILHKLIDKIASNTLPPQFTNHTFGPTFIDDFTKVIDWVIRTRTTGLFHASAGEAWTDYQFAQKVLELAKLSGQITPGDLDEYLKSSSRPYQKNTALDCTKLTKELDFSQHSVADAIAQVVG